MLCKQELQAFLALKGIVKTTWLNAYARESSRV
jgi:hypothetical protein